MAVKLHDDAGVEMNELGSTLEDVKTFAKHLGIQISIVDADQFNNIIFTTDSDYDTPQMIYLFKNKNHFDVITSMPGFLCTDYYCHSCKKAYTHRDKHRCPAKCIACYKYFPKGAKCSGEQITCNDCNITFLGQKCFEEHKRNRAKKEGITNSVCDIVFKCLKCERTLTADKDKGLKHHSCGFSKCSNCQTYCDLTLHQCHMKNSTCKGGYCMKEPNCKELTKIDKKQKKCYQCKTYTEKYMFFDFECNQETGVHEVNLAVLQDFEGKEWVFKKFNRIL